MRDWLSSYLHYTKEQESPELFHFWSGLTTLAATIQRNIFIDRGYYKLFPNLYTVLVAPSGRCKKSTAARIGVSMLMDAEVKNVITEKITPQALTQFLSNQIQIIDKKAVGTSSVFIFAPELSVFLGKDASISGLLALLTSLYECPDKWEYHTKTQGTDYLRNVCINVLGASTSDWLSHGIPVDAIGGGLTARIAFVAQVDTPRRILFPKITPELKATRRELVEYLIRLKDVKMVIELSSGARDFFNSWYDDRDVPEDDRFASFFEREHDHILKVAMLLAVSRGDIFQHNVISEVRLKEAMSAIDTLKDYMPLAYSGIGEHMAAKGYDRVTDQLKTMGGKCDHSTLLRKNWYHFDTETFKKVMDLLIETGRVEMRVTKGGKKIYYLCREE